MLLLLLSRERNTERSATATRRRPPPHLFGGRSILCLPNTHPSAASQRMRRRKREEEEENTVLDPILSLPLLAPVCLPPGDAHAGCRSLSDCCRLASFVAFFFRFHFSVSMCACLARVFNLFFFLSLVYKEVARDAVSSRTRPRTVRQACVRLFPIGRDRHASAPSFSRFLRVRITKMNPRRSVLS